jgi:hypothetical protein
VGDVFGDALGALLIDVIDGDASALFGESFGDALTNAIARAGDQNGLTCDPHLKPFLASPPCWVEKAQIFPQDDKPRRWGLPAPKGGFQLLGLLLLKDQIKLNCLFFTKAKQSKRTLAEVIFSQV